MVTTGMLLASNLLLEDGFRQGGFAVIAIVLYVISKALWNRYVDKDESQIRQLVEQVKAQQELIEGERKARERLLHTENSAKNQALDSQQAQRLQEVSNLRRETVQLRELLEKQLGDLRSDSERLHKQLSDAQELRVEEAMKIVHAAEAQREANDILESLVQALASANRESRAESQAIRQLLEQHLQRMEPVETEPEPDEEAPR
jgi:Mg2+ and Co2+ transporter CorA